MDWIWWVALGLFAGINMGVALMAVIQLSPGHGKVKPAPQWSSMAGVSPLEGSSTIF